MIETYFETFAAAIDAAQLRATEEQAVLSRPADLWNICQSALPHGHTRVLSLPLDSFKGKSTRKYFHIAIHRMESGRYELTNYIL